MANVQEKRKREQVSDEDPRSVEGLDATSRCPLTELNVDSMLDTTTAGQKAVQHRQKGAQPRRLQSKKRSIEAPADAPRPSLSGNILASSEPPRSPSACTSRAPPAAVRQAQGSSDGGTALLPVALDTTDESVTPVSAIAAIPSTSRSVEARVGQPKKPQRDETRTSERIKTLLPNRIGKALDGRVCSKTSLRQRSRENDTLSVFSFVIQDETGKINVTAWDDIAKQVYDTVKVGSCFRFTMYKIKEANMANQAYRVTDHTHELTLSKWSKVISLPDDALPPLRSKLLSIVQLYGKGQNAIVDLIAVLFEVGPVHYINCQDGRTRPKRNVTLIDESCKSVTLGLWPDFIGNLNGCEGCAIMFQNLQVREYAGKLMLSTTTNTIITIDADHETFHDLNQWFAKEGCANAYEELEWTALSSKTVGEE